VKIRVQTLPDVVHVPVEAVFEHDAEHYCVQPDGESFRLRRVTLGPTNDETVVIQDGLEVGEQLAIGAASYRDEFDPPDFRAATPGDPIMHRVKRGEFVHEITERGSVESAENVEIECEVEGYSTMILWVIAEGTHVEPVPDWEPDPDNPQKNPPDLLVKLDASAWEDRRIQQQTWCKTTNAVVIRAKKELEKARIALEEYVEGRYKQEKQTIESRILLARQEYGRAQQYLEDSEALLARRFVAAREVHKDHLAVVKAKMEMEAARTALGVLADYTKPKTETSLRAQIETAVVQLDTEEKKHELNLKKLAHIEEQIEKCRIRAPAAGQVVYARDKNWWGQPIVIEEGTRVREHQPLIRLPDLTEMQIKATINEATAVMVREGMRAKIHLDAFPDVELTGSVLKVNEYPVASTLLGTAAKEYEATVEIDELPVDDAGRSLDIRPGMTAQVRILVEALPDVMQVPVQAVVEHDGWHYCVRSDGERYGLRRVAVGSTNDRAAVILEGLKVGDEVVIDPMLHRDALNLPQSPPQIPVRPAGTGAKQPSVGQTASSKESPSSTANAPTKPPPDSTPIHNI